MSWPRSSANKVHSVLKIFQAGDSASEFWGLIFGPGKVQPREGTPVTLKLRHHHHHPSRLCSKT